MKRVLLTGASGHLGQAVTRQLVSARIPLLAVGRRPESLRKVMEVNSSEYLATAVVDLNAPESILAAVERYGPFQKLIHLAAQVDAGATLDDHISGNLLTTISLVGCLRERLEQVVYLSSIDTYGMPRTCPMREDHPTSPNTYYGAGKLAGEKFLQVFAMERGATVSILRCSSIYGPGEKIHRATTAFLQNTVAGKSIFIAGDGSDLRDYIYVEDAARAVYQSMQAGRSGVYNLGGGAPLSIDELANIVIRVSGKKLALEHGARSKQKYDLALDISKIHAEIGFRPRTSMEEGLAAEYQSLLTPQRQDIPGFLGN